KWVYKYENGRRISEGLQKGDAYQPHYFYVYDADGRLIAEGPPVAANTPPPRYDESMLALDVSGFAPIAPMLTIDPNSDLVVPIAYDTYFYDSSGRLRLIGDGATPGIHLRRVDLSYEGGRLTTVKVSHNDATEPAFEGGTRTYKYD